MADLTTIKNWFRTGLKQTQTQYWDTWDSFWHKDENIPQATIIGLSQALEGKAPLSADIKVIDKLVTDKAYFIKEEDFGKTLFYNGAESTTIVLSTNTKYELGNQLYIIQAGEGTIQFGIDGFILNHSYDQLPQLYGSHSMAAIMITNIENPEVLIYGKLKLA